MLSPQHEYTAGKLSTHFDVFNSSDHLKITAFLGVALHRFGCVNICLNVHV